MRRQPLQDFEAPPNEIGADRYPDRDLHQLDDQFVFWHRQLRLEAHLIKAMWLSLITFAQVATWPSMKVLKFACVMMSGMAPCFLKFAWMSARDRISEIVLL